MIKKILIKHKKHWTEKSLLFSSLVGFLFFSVSLFINQVAANYATRAASNPVNDILLSNLPVFNVDFIVNDVAIMFMLFIIGLLILEPKRVPFVLKSVAIFIAIRSAFVILTHLGPFPERSVIYPDDYLRSLNIGGDYFFSGHTGLPFLMALVFWDEKWIRNVCIAGSLVFGAAVILGHLHYSIDVFGAFFITYTIFHLAKKFFPEDFELFRK
jgi:membrane-associated phospholipid phosphatase